MNSAVLNVQTLIGANKLGENVLSMLPALTNAETQKGKEMSSRHYIPNVEWPLDVHASLLSFAAEIRRQTQALPRSCQNTRLHRYAL
jgi:hypothetical protein